MTVCKAVASDPVAINREAALPGFESMPATLNCAVQLVLVQTAFVKSRQYLLILVRAPSIKMPLVVASAIVVLSLNRVLQEFASAVNSPELVFLLNLIAVPNE